MILTHLPLVYTAFYHPITHTKEAVDGKISLENYNVNDRILLDGQWSFYWRQLIVTDEDKNLLSFFIKTPGYWSDYTFEGKRLPTKGYASYKLKIVDFSSSEPMTVYIPDFGGAYRTYIDGQLAAESGTLSKNTSEIDVTPNAILYPVDLSERDDHEIVIEVASKRFSGLYMTPILRNYDLAYSTENTKTHFEFMMFGMIIFAFVMMSVVYVVAFKKGRRSPWLIIMLLAVILRIMLTTSFYSNWKDHIFFGLSYEDINPLMFFVSFLYKYLLIYLFQEQFNLVISRHTKVFFLGYYFSIFFIYQLVPVAFYNQYLNIAIPIASFAVETYLFWRLIRAHNRMTNDNLLSFIGVLIAFSGIVINSYYINGNIYLDLSMIFLITLTISMFIFSIVYTLHIARVYNEIALTSAQYEMTKERISIQKEYYDSVMEQVSETKRIKHDLHHFVGTIEVLIKSQKFDQIDMLIQQYGRKLAEEPIEVYCEHVIANSIIGYYHLKAKEKQINLSAKTVIPSSLSIEDAELCIILGNALENAIEATEQIEDLSKRMISLEANIVNQQFLIKVTNSHQNNVTEKEGKLISTKNSFEHGLGLTNIRRSVDCYNGYLNITADKTTFSLMAAIAIQ